jgi:branched-subunit amino acid transport protein AzlD
MTSTMRRTADNHLCCYLLLVLFCYILEDCRVLVKAVSVLVKAMSVLLKAMIVLGKVMSLLVKTIESP